MKQEKVAAASVPMTLYETRPLQDGNDFAGVESVAESYVREGFDLDGNVQRFGLQFSWDRQSCLLQPLDMAFDAFMRHLQGMFVIISNG